MIKLNWYALTKPHVVHRYYRIKERPIAIGSLYVHEYFRLRIRLPNKDVDRGIYDACRRVLNKHLAYSPHTTISRVEQFIEETTVTLEVEWLNTK